MAIIEIFPSYDGDIRDDDTKDDTSSVLQVGTDTIERVVYKFRSFIKFPLDQIPAGAEITKVRLKLECTGAGDVAHLLDIHPDGGDGYTYDPEVDTGWATLGARCAAGVEYINDSTEARSTGTKWFDLGASAITDLNNAIASGLNRYSLGLHEEGDDTLDALFASVDHGTVEYRPVLEVTYTGFTGNQGHFKWFKDQWKLQDRPAEVKNKDPVRLRVCLHEIEGKNWSAQDIQVEFSKDKNVWKKLEPQGTTSKYWKLPDGFNDLQNRWTDEPKAYDNDLATYAYAGVTAVEYDVMQIDFLFDSPIVANRLKLYFSKTYDASVTGEVRVLKDGVWKTVYTSPWGALPYDQWIYIEFAEGWVEKIRLIFDVVDHVTSGYLQLRELQAWLEREPFRFRADPDLADKSQISSAQLSCTTELGNIYESEGVDSESISANAHHEISVILEPYEALTGKAYYFRVIVEG